MTTSTANKYPTERRAGREHIPIYPRGFVAIRFVQLFLAVVVLGLTAFGAYLAPIASVCLALFVSSATLIVTIWNIICHYSTPKLYNYWAVLALDIFLVIFWLSSFALMASEAAILFEGNWSCDWAGNCVQQSVSGPRYIFASCLAGASGIGAVLFCLFIASLVIHSIKLHRHRKAGLHCSPLENGEGHGHVGHVAAEPEKTNAQVATNPVQQQQQQPPIYAQPDQGYNNGPAYPQQAYAPNQATSPVQQGGMYPPPQQQMPQGQPGFYPQSTGSPAPVAAQHTGGSGFHAPQQNNFAAPQPGSPHEVPAQSYPQQQQQQQY